MISVTIRSRTQSSAHLLSGLASAASPAKKAAHDNPPHGSDRHRRGNCTGPAGHQRQHLHTYHRHRNDLGVLFKSAVAYSNVCIASAYTPTAGPR
jgi:hypothetical protein